METITLLYIIITVQEHSYQHKTFQYTIGTLLVIQIHTTGQPNDEVLYTGLESPFSYAYYSEKTSVLVRHNNAVQGNIVFGSTTATSSYSLYYTPNSLFNLSPYFSIGWTFISNQTIEFFLSVIVM